jgi:serine/threonine protein phosphatase PrpC
MEPGEGGMPPTTDREPEDGNERAPLWRDNTPGAPTIGEVRPATTPVLNATNWRRLPMHAADGGEIGAWWLSAASLVGMSHLATAHTRQDDYSFGLLSDGSLVAVVADGLGSYAETAQIGATLMVQALVAAMARAGDHADDLLTVALQQAQEGAIDIGRRMYELSAEQLSCTLVACRVTDAGLVEFVRVGDADAFLWSGEDADFTRVFNGRDDSAPVNLVEAACPRARTDQVERIDVPLHARIVLCSDGLAMDIQNSPTLREYLAGAWRQPLSAAAMLESLRYRRQGSHDDRTGLVVWSHAASSADERDVSR